MSVESAMQNVDETYKKYINEEHSHLWVKMGDGEIFSVLGTKYDLKNGNSTDILKLYQKYIEQIRLSSNDLESELRAKNRNIYDMLNEIK